MHIHRIWTEKKEQRKNEGDTHKAALPVSNSIDADTAGEGEGGKGG